MSKAVIPETKFLTFVYLKNTNIYLSGTHIYTIPSDMRNVPVNNIQQSPFAAKRLTPGSPEATAVQPVFDMDFVHAIPLKNERPIVPKKPADMSDAYHAKLCDQAYDRAAEAKVYNDDIRNRVYHYVKDGQLAIVDDPYADEEEIVEGISEMAEAIKADKAAETELTVSHAPPKPKKTASKE